MSSKPSYSQNGNLVTLVGGGQSEASSSAPRPSGTRLLVSNLPASLTFDRVSQMTTSCGSVKTIRVENGKAEVEFADLGAANAFFRQTHRQIVDSAVLNVSRIA